MSSDYDHKNFPRADPKLIIKLYEQGIMPSQIGVQLNISLHEILDVLEKHRKENAPIEAAKKTI